MNGLLLIDASHYAESVIKTQGFLPTLKFGFEMLLIGMATVFSVLALLWGCLCLFKIFFYDLKNKKKAEETTIAEATTDTGASDTSDDEEIIAVIAAAIAAAENEQPGLKFRVVAFNRK